MIILFCPVCFCYSLLLFCRPIVEHFCQCVHWSPKEYIRKLDEVFGKDGSKLCQMKVNDFASRYVDLFEKMRPTLNKTTGAGLLKDYSPWLTSFQANQYSEYIEIPGEK